MLAATFSLVVETQPGDTAGEDALLQAIPPNPYSIIETVKSEDNVGLVARTRETPPMGLSDFRMRTKVSRMRIETGAAVLSLQSSSRSLIDPEAARKGDDTSKFEKTFVVSFLWRFSSCRRDFRITIKDAFDTWSFQHSSQETLRQVKSLHFVKRVTLEACTYP